MMNRITAAKKGASTILAATFLALSFQCGLSHHFWLEIEDYRPNPGTGVPVTIRIGDSLPGERFPRTPDHIRKFEVIHQGEALPIRGRANAHPAGIVPIHDNGLHSIVYYSHPTTTTLTQETFRQYLREEGLKSALGSLDKKEAPTTSEVTETFTRCAKALLSAGDVEEEAVPSWTQMPLEITPKATPSRLQSGETLPVGVRFQGEPLADTLVKAYHRSLKNGPLHQRTNRDGEISLPLKASGFWVLSTVHIERLESAAEAEWQSTWASLSFEIPE